MNGVSGAFSRAMPSAAMPSKCGMEKSERITSGENSRSASEKACSVSTMRCSTRMPARFSSRISSSASEPTSSVRRIRIASVGTSVRDTVDEHPVKAEFRDGVVERLELHRLHDVAVHAEAIALEDIALLIRGCHHHDGNRPRHGVGFQAAQDFDAVDLGHLDVKKHELRR